MHLPHHGGRGRRTTAALSGALLALALLAGCGDDDPAEAEDPATSPAGETSGATEPTTEPTSETSRPAETDEPGRTVVVEVFFVGDTPRGPRLFAEQHAVDAEDPLNAAAALLTSGGTKDPDYRTLLPEGSFGTIAHDGDSFLVPVQDDGWRQPVGQTKREARLAVQQLIYTLQAVQGVDDQADISLGDTPEESLFGVDVSDGVRPAPELDVRAHVNVLSPVEEETVSGSFTAEGLASSFEATVPWEVRDPSGEVVVDGFSTAEGWIDRLYPWTAEVDVSGLQPGEYTFVAMTDDPSGGEGGGPVEDSKTIVVD